MQIKELYIWRVLFNKKQKTVTRGILFLIAISTTLIFNGCANTASQVSAAISTMPQPGQKNVSKGFIENFESGNKGAYTKAVVTLSTGNWELEDALIAGSPNDAKNDGRSVRIKGEGVVTMLFDKSDGARQVTVVHGSYGSDAPCSWGLWYSVNSGDTWIQAADNVTTSSVQKNKASFNLNISGSVRFQIRKIAGGRLNIDDFSIDDGHTENAIRNTSAVQPLETKDATRDDNMAMGNPSNATSSPANRNNYLMQKPQYTLSYNNAKGMANWVSWHLSTAWKGSATRCNCFEPDNALPAGFFSANTYNYTGTGFDRGHLCPSDDRDGSAEDNAATFAMTNMSPQAPHLNQLTWEALESYCRKLITQGNELYIIAGGYGTGGIGSKDVLTNNIANGAINVPSRFWKVIVVLPVGASDVTRVNVSTRVIAVDMPNLQTVSEQKWGYYRTTVDAIEAATGYDLLSNISLTIQKEIESRVDAGPVN